MLKYRAIQLFMYIMILAVVLCDLFIYPIPIGVEVSIFLGIFAVFIGFCIWGAKNVDSGFFIDVLCKGKTDQKIVALSFDDGPAARFTPQILDILQQHNTPAAFFCIGRNIEGNEEIMERMHADGHVIGNHSYSHDFWFDMKSARKMKSDLFAANHQIQEFTGSAPMLFRPPYGVTNPNLAKAIQQNGLIPVGWSIRSLDTVIKDENKLMERVTANIRPGDIFLFHDHCEATVKILPALIQHIWAQGFTIQRIDKLLKVPAYA